MADGIILPVGCSRHFVKYAIQNVKVGAERAGRDPKEVDISALIAFSAAKDSKRARDEVRGLIATLGSFGTSSLSKMANRRFIEPFAEEDVRPIRETLHKRGLMVDTFAVAGTPDECLGRLSE